MSDVGSPRWRARPYRELDSAGDRDQYNEAGKGWRVWKGNTFDRYQPDLAAPVYWAEPEPVLERLQRKRLGSRGVFPEFPQKSLKNPRTLPPYDCRILFRDVVRATDRRTMKACLAPPEIFAMEKSPQLVWPRGTERDVLTVLAVFNSLVFDWLTRRRVENKMAFGILNALPIPDLCNARNRLAELKRRRPPLALQVQSSLSTDGATGHGQTVTRFVERAGNNRYDAALIDEQASRGRTLIEKFDEHAAGRNTPSCC